MDIKIQSIAEKFIANQPISLKELPLLRSYLESFIDKDWLAVQLTEYQSWSKQNSDPFLQYNFLHRPTGFNMLAASFWAEKYWEQEFTNDDPKMSASRLLNIAISISILELYAEEWLDVSAREYLKQRLQSTDSLWGVIHELNTYSFFIRNKAKRVEPYFLKRASTREIIVDWDGDIIPVECKNIRSGTGRMISQDTFITLAGYIANDTVKNGQQLLVKIGTTGIIPDEDIDYIRSQVKINAGKTISPILIKKNSRLYSIMTKQIPDITFTYETTKIFIDEYLPNYYLLMIIANPALSEGKYRPSSIVGIQTNPIEKPLNSLDSAIGKGIRQLPGDKPGILAIYYTDHIANFDHLCPGDITMQEYISNRLSPFTHIGAVLISSEPNYLGLDESKTGRTFLFYRKPWAFSGDFLQNVD